MFTVGRIKSAAAVIVSTRADEPFFRGDEPERSPSHTVVASPRCSGKPTYGCVEGALSLKVHGHASCCVRAHERPLAPLSELRVTEHDLVLPWCD